MSAGAAVGWLLGKLDAAEDVWALTAGEAIEGLHVYPPSAPSPPPIYTLFPLSPSMRQAA